MQNRFFKHFGLTDVLLLGVYFAVVTYLFFPGFMTVDSINQLKIGRSGHFPDNHPPLFSLFWGLIDKLVDGPAAMLFLQLAMLIGGIILLARVTVGLNSRLRYLFYTLLIFPPLLGVVGVIWKDIWMQNLFLLGFGLTVLASMKTGKYKVLFFALSLFCLFAAVTARHNAIAGTLPICGLLMYLLIEKYNFSKLKTGLLSIFGGIAITVAIFFSNTLFNKIIVDQKVNFSQVMMNFDISGMSALQDENLYDEGYDKMFFFRPTSEEIRARFSSRYHACLYRSCKVGDLETSPMLAMTDSPADLERLRNNWKDSITRHPITYLHHKILVSQHILGLSKADDVWGPTLRNPIIANNLGYSFKDTPLKSSFREKIYELSKTSLYASWLYLVTAFAMTVGVILGWYTGVISPRKGAISTSLLLSGIFYQGSLVIGATSPDFRYSLWMIICVILTLFTVFTPHKAMK